MSLKDCEFCIRVDLNDDDWADAAEARINPRPDRDIFWDVLAANLTIVVRGEEFVKPYAWAMTDFCLILDIAVRAMQDKEDGEILIDQQLEGFSIQCEWHGPGVALTQVFTKATAHVPKVRFLEEARRFLTWFARTAAERIPDFFGWDGMSVLAPYAQAE